MDIAIFPALIKLPRKVYRHHITKVFAIKSRLLLDILIHEFGIVHLRIMLERVLPVKRECAVTYMVSTGKICGSTLLIPCFTFHKLPAIVSIGIKAPFAKRGLNTAAIIKRGKIMGIGIPLIDKTAKGGTQRTG